MKQSNRGAVLTRAIRGCASWQDIQDKWRSFPEKQKGDIFEKLVKAYLQLDPEYASKLKRVWLLREVPQAITRAVLTLGNTLVDHWPPKEGNPDELSNRIHRD